MRESPDGNERAQATDALQTATEVSQKMTVFKKIRSGGPLRWTHFLKTVGRKYAGLRHRWV